MGWKRGLKQADCPYSRNALGGFWEVAESMFDLMSDVLCTSRYDGELLQYIAQRKIVKDILKSVPFGDMLEAFRKDGKETADKDEREDESEESCKGSSSNDEDDDETRKEKLRLK